MGVQFTPNINVKTIRKLSLSLYLPLALRFSLLEMCSTTTLNVVVVVVVDTVMQVYIRYIRVGGCVPT